MAADTKDLQVKDKQEVTSTSEQTKPGLVFTPAVDIFENETELVLLADMPGVTAGTLDIDLREDTLTLLGEIETTEELHGEQLLTEYEIGKFYRQFTIPEVIDQEGIDAQLKDGVLRLTLPKVQKATQRKIAITSA
ncbi:heat-shock protein [Desulfoluna limicola]|uniref:Heat-shock protein n=1 Tax=Desulfoluna limicola TaxID=2810562 RepID=A0ABM7PBM0_9BACT|nr:Hsp20/alpha crystallin family protein [Desulfoluna limicola]BCS94490.1 heat-shock protein [Desulfoluna limicola]